MKFKDVESNIVRCPDAKAAEKMIRLIEKMRREGNTVGGIVEGVARGVPAGWGEPVFDKLEADLAKAMLSLPASKAFESRLRLRRHFADRPGAQRPVPRARRKSFHDHEPFRRHPGRHLERRDDFFPRRVQAGRHRHARAGHGGRSNLHNTTLKGRGRHDPCVLPRAVPMVEAMTALVLVDHALRHKAQCG